MRSVFFRLKVPSTLVAVAIVVPLTMTVAPMTGAPVSSSTRPEMPVVCAHSNDAENTAVTSNSAFREKRLVEKLIHTNFKVKK